MDWCMILIYAGVGIFTLVAFILPMCLRPASDETFVVDYVDCKGEKISKDMQMAFVEELNKLRSKTALGNMPNNNKYKMNPYPPATSMFRVTWNCSLAKGAQEYADKCQGEHSSGEIDTPRGKAGAGENLHFADTPNHVNKTDAEIARWATFGFSESEMAKPGMSTIKVSEGHIDENGKPRTPYEPTGHAVQCMYDDLTDFGCGVKKCTDFIKKSTNTHIAELKYIVCWYYGMNISKTYFYEEGPTLSNCPAPHFPNRKTGLCEQSATNKFVFLSILYTFSSMFM